jgi:predicted metal-binding membrane protein
MGLAHSIYCIGCCWLFMLVLFVAGAMSLLWMGAISVAIFVEKVGWRPLLVTRGIGVALAAVGVLFVVQALLPM